LVPLLTFEGNSGLKTSDAVISLFLGFLTVITLVLLSEAPILNRVAAILVALGLCVAVGVFVYYHNKPKKYERPKFATESSTKRKQILKGIFFCIEVFEGSSFIMLPIASWQVTFINGIPIITYINAIMGAMLIGGLLILRDLVRRVRAYRKKNDINVLLDGYL
jgi:hypothetical protein